MILLHFPNRGQRPHAALEPHWIEQVGDHDREAGVARPHGVVLEPLVQPRAAGGRHAAEELEQAHDVPAAARGRPALRHPLAQHPHAHALHVDEADEAQRRGDARAVLELRRRSEVHGRRGVEQQVQTELLLVDEELDVQPIEAAVDVPVHVAEVVADAVAAIVAELDAVPAPRAPALALHAPAEDPARVERQALELRQELGAQQRGARRGHANARRGTGSSSGSGRGSRVAPAPA